MIPKSVLLLVLSVSINLYGQNANNLLHDKYYEGIYHYLSPGSGSDNREFLFISLTQDGSPEYSLALKNYMASYVLTVIRFDLPYWPEVLMNYQQTGIVSGRISTYDTDITRNFGNLLTKYFFTVVQNPPLILREKPQVNDANQYIFLMSPYKRELDKFYFPDNPAYRQLTEICEDIASDIRRGHLTEGIYIKIINSE